ncbi:MAG TPA: DUF58 domain-containing protein [Burkholderiales bacterium]|jgi:uncharacterized protein (DUF58 family)|nr:DUF58 domain-containing protein [Burkholderiales bacterium]
MDRWLFQLGGTPVTSIVLVQRRIFIVPSRHGLLFVAALAMMLSGSINYNLNLGFILTFLLAALGMNAILHTFRNLARLQISAGRVPAVFAGDTARFTLIIDNPTTLERYSIGVANDSRELLFTDAPALQATTVGVPVAALQRGILRPGRLKLFTQFPLGLCYAWAYAQLDMQCIVYPRPEGGRVPLPPPSAGDATGITHGTGLEDFAGLRSYHPGDSPRHIAWKAAARGESLLTKQFSGRAARERWLEWHATADSMGVEARLARLARWVVDAHAAGFSFGLRLPGVTLKPAPGDAQRERCLEALALYQGAQA